jgi:hypothetical protein
MVVISFRPDGKYKSWMLSTLLPDGFGPVDLEKDRVAVNTAPK